MSALLNEINTLCAEIRSDKVLTRNKGMDRLDAILTHSKDELIVSLSTSKNNVHNLTWNDIFESVFSATYKHSEKVSEAMDSKNFQTLRNRNYIYQSVISKIIDYNLEDDNNYLSKSVILDAFIEGITKRFFVRNFGSLLLQLLDRGIYKSEAYVRELKVNEFSRILSYLFELNVDNDEVLQFSVLRTIIKSIELAVQHVQLAIDIVEYLAEVSYYAKRAKDDRRKSDVIKLYYLFISELSVDYHNRVCIEIQELLPELCGLHSFDMKADIKETLFKSVYLSLLAIYPHLHEGNLNTMNVTLADTWPKTIRKLKTMVDIEIKERTLKSRYRSSQAEFDKSWDHFIKMSSAVIYIINWHIDAVGQKNDDAIEGCRSKVMRLKDNCESILSLVKQEEANFSEIWLAILAELLTFQHDIVNLSNFKPILNIVFQVLHIYSNARNLRNVRLCITSLLCWERKQLPPDHCKDLWLELIERLISDTLNQSDIIFEKQLLLQQLIQHKKLTTAHCVSVQQFIMSNAIMKRTECMNTMREMLINANECGIDKSGEKIGSIINWAYEAKEKINAKSVLLHITPIEPELVADTCAIAVTNFLNENQNFKNPIQSFTQYQYNQELLLYRNNRKFICLERHGKEYSPFQLNDSTRLSESKRNCVFQLNYELLMRAVNFETTKETKCSDILLDLGQLQKMVCLMRSFIFYDVFDRTNLEQCPLIKRIGFFLSHLEFQLKNNDPRKIERSDLLDVLQLLDNICRLFIFDKVLLQYFERQPLDELIGFLGTALKSISRQFSNDFDDWSGIVFVSLKTLATICGSSTHSDDAFQQLSKHKVNIKKDLYNFLDVVEVLCKHRNMTENIAIWMVNTLKSVFSLYHTDIRAMDRLIGILPAIFLSVQSFEDPLTTMLIALQSLLKIGYTKSYPTRIIVKLIDNIRQISHNYPNICDEGSFTNICLSVAKFLPFPSLEIQFAAINTITALMDINWITGISGGEQVHYEFCQQLFDLIDWKNLPATTEDTLQTSNAITVQTLISLFMFSLYHKDIALEELTFFCAQRKLSEANLIAYHDRVYDTTIPELVKPYIINAIHAWMAQNNSILKFPDYLYSKTKNEFIKDNLSLISTCCLLYGKEANFADLKEYASVKDLVKLALPSIIALELPTRAACKESEASEHKLYVQQLMESKHLKHFRTHNKELKSSSGIHWETLYQLMNFLNDTHHFESLFGFPIVYKENKWYNISHTSLLKCLNYYLCGSEMTTNPFVHLIATTPLVLVDVLNALKKQCADTAFAMQKLHNFFLYCTLINETLDAITFDKMIENYGKYFIRDTIFFTLYILANAKNNQLEKIALVFLLEILKKPILFSEPYIDVVRKYLNDICKTLVAYAEKTHTSNLNELTIKILNYLMIVQQQKLSDAIPLLDEFPSNAEYQCLRDAIAKFVCSEGHDDKDSLSVLRAFLRMKNRGIEGLRAIQCHILKNKRQLQEQNDELIYELVKRFLDLARNSENDEYRLEVVKCLGAIGSLQIEGASYYFKTDVSFYEGKSVKTDTLLNFIQCMIVVIDKSLIVFNSSTQSIAGEVARMLLNSNLGENFRAEFPYLTIFHSPMKSTNYLNRFQISNRIDWLQILNSTESSKNYENWICNFVSKIFETSNWMEFKKLATKDYFFAESALEPFVELLMEHKDTFLSDLITMLEYFFNELDSALETVNGTIFRDKCVIIKFLNICECIRLHNNWILPINLLQVAKACNYCQAYFMSVMYLEMWALANKSANGTQTLNIIADKTFQETATKAYQSIGCCDAISGFLDPMNSLINFLDLENAWPDMLLETNSNDKISDELYTSILKRNGMLSLASQSRKESEIDYEICWRLCQWDTPVEGHDKVNILNDMEKEFEKHHFNALKCLFHREENNSLAAIANARQCITIILKEISLECLQGVYKYLTWLQMLQQIDDFCKVQFITKTPIEGIFQRWQTEVELTYGSFQCKEQILSHQIALFNTAGIRADRKVQEFYKQNPVQMCLLKSIKECKEAGELNLSKLKIATLRKMDITDAQTKVSMLLEDAEVRYKSGMPQITESILKHVTTNSSFSCCLQRIRATRLLGEHLLELNTETFDNVLEKYFKKTKILCSTFIQEKDRILEKYPNAFQMESLSDFEKSNNMSIFANIAKYADREYTQLNEFMNSEEFQIRRKIIQENREAVAGINRLNADRDKLASATFMKKFANIDEQELLTVEKKRTTNLCVAIENYIKFCTIDSTVSSVAIYRIIALWFANKRNESVNIKIQELIGQVPSYKFVCALNQMTARLNSNNETFINILKDILVRCVQDHPQQTLPQLFALVHAFNDAKLSGKGKNTSDSNNRVAIAKEIIKNGENAGNSKCIQQLEMIFPALIEFANVGLNRQEAPPEFALSDKLKLLKNMDAVQCLTLHLPIAVDKQYNNITTIIKWNEKVPLVGGINVPKKLSCLCSDGKGRPQLLKGKDDLRQDAVMQQVFLIINDLLSVAPETAKRKLSLRTYKIVPLSMRSGILEWCENTIPFGMYLMGENGAHKKYRPQDWLPGNCRKLAMKHLMDDSEKRHKVFKEICKKIQPVFHYFFFENFLVPGIWFERRLVYTNSVATTSMVGYILGLGDRHTQNILIDQKTAEVIHIDFGIAFEQGKVMPTPETVPFRLTRDMLSPMGVCEANGIFKKSCEATLNILRQNQSVITTILEVLLYDPLYIWKAIPDRASNHDSSSNERTNLSAHRALLRVQNKLEGKQEGIPGTAGVETQVQRLINEAISSRNLSLLYPGWDPYL